MFNVPPASVQLIIDRPTPPPFSEVLLPATRLLRLRAGTLPHTGTPFRLAMTISEEGKDYLNSKRQ
jgi:hypothetical protein